jgi:hypothetical protein
MGIPENADIYPPKGFYIPFGGITDLLCEAKSDMKGV